MVKRAVSSLLLVFLLSASHVSASKTTCSVKLPITVAPSLTSSSTGSTALAETNAPEPVTGVLEGSLSASSPPQVVEVDEGSVYEEVAPSEDDNVGTVTAPELEMTDEDKYVASEGEGSVGEVGLSNTTTASSDGAQYIDYSTLIADATSGSADTIVEVSTGIPEGCFGDGNGRVNCNPQEPPPTETPAPSPTTIIPAPVVLTVPNWVGPTIGVAADTACYRKTHSMDQCPIGYESDGGTCWAQCPLEYPVECGMECIPQNEDCALEILSKIFSLANVALNAATAGVAGNLLNAGKKVTQGVKCGQQLFSVLQRVVKDTQKLQTDYPNGSEDEILFMMSNLDFVVTDLPIAITTCLGTTLPEGMKDVQLVTNVATGILKIVYTQGDMILNPDTYLDLLTDVGLGDAVKDLTDDDLTELKTLIQSNDTCGFELNSLTNRIYTSVQAAKNATPTASAAQLRYAVQTSSLYLVDIPSVTSNCVADTSQQALATRLDIRKTMDEIINAIVDAADDDDGNPLSTADYALRVTDIGLSAISLFDPTGLASLAQEWIQPICGPTSFIGEVDDGPLDQALGLKTIDDAFDGSYGTWSREGDGVLVIIFESTDDEDVSVNIFSGGDKIDEVDVDSGETVTWTRNISEMQDKTLYMDRWRPGFLGLPGTGGGSFLMWIPHSTTGGHIELHAKINVS